MTSPSPTAPARTPEAILEAVGAILNAPLGTWPVEGEPVAAPEAATPAAASPPSFRYELPARQFRFALNALITREIGYHVQAAARMERAPQRLEIRVECTPEGVRLRSLDGRVAVLVPALVSQARGARGGEAHYVVSAEDLEAAADRYVGWQAGPDARLAVDAGVAQLAVERVGAVAPTGKAHVVHAVLGAVQRDAEACPMPLVMAWGLRALALGEARAADAVLQALLQQAAVEVESRAFEMWRVELPLWTRALADVFPSKDATVDAQLLALANARLAAGLAERDLDELAAMTLAAGLLERRSSLAIAVVAPVPLHGLLHAVEGTSERRLGELLPSEEARLAAFETAPLLRALAPVLRAHGDVSGIVRQLDRYAPVIGEAEQRDAAKLAQGKVREVNRAYADRLQSLSPAVLAAALLAHQHPNAESRLALLDPDTALKASRLSARWASLGGLPLPDDVLDAASDQLEERLTLPDDIRERKQRSDDLRTLAARKKRPAEVTDYFPNLNDVSPWRIALAGGPPTVGRVQDVADAKTEVAVTLPPAALAAQAIERVAPIVVHIPSRTAVFTTAGLTALWSPEGIGDAADAAEAATTLVRGIPARGPVRGAFALTGDELGFAHAIARGESHSVAGKDPGAGIVVSAVARQDGMALLLGPGAEIQLSAGRTDVATRTLRSALPDLNTLTQAARTEDPTATQATVFDEEEEPEFRRPLVLRGAAVGGKLAQLAEGTLRGRALRDRITPESADDVAQGGRPDEVRMTLWVDGTDGSIEMTSSGPRGIRRETVVVPSTTAATRPQAADRTPVMPDAFANAIELARAGAAATAEIKLQPAITGSPLVVLRERLAMVVRPVSTVRVTGEAPAAPVQPATSRAVATRATVTEGRDV